MMDGEEMVYGQRGENQRVRKRRRKKSEKSKKKEREREREFKGFVCQMSNKKRTVSLMTLYYYAGPLIIISRFFPSLPRKRK